MTDSSRQATLFRLRGRPAALLAGIALLAVGGGAGALAMQATRPSVTMAPAAPSAIRSLSSGSIVTIRGQVTEVYGNKFVLTDASGRALVDTGRDGEDRALVTTGAPVTVQGRFEHGFVHAAFLVGADRKVVALGPLMGPRGGPDHRGPRHGPGEELASPPPPVQGATPGAAPVAPPAPPANPAG